MRGTIKQTIVAVAAILLLAFSAKAEQAKQRPGPAKAGNQWVVTDKDLHAVIAVGFEVRAATAETLGPRLILQKGSEVYSCYGGLMGQTFVPMPKQGETVVPGTGLCWRLQPWVVDTDPGR